MAREAELVAAAEAEAEALLAARTVEREMEEARAATEATEATEAAGLPPSTDTAPDEEPAASEKE